jgi:hypothetical protein
MIAGQFGVLQLPNKRVLPKELKLPPFPLSSILGNTLARGRRIAKQ